ncbi:sugar/nucleoside kinase (ribokinase family) [Devosia subaequoris]|uniref:Sugar/nucleoside kinase (Ribokinase family) n=1 Tax=Devosia subaequoris TaxID=395930 RepID=A0A7W6NB84_9HYPH|nr:sugar/nucleoside kinase (ribokinase family) [Devosia subaequoris]
MITIFGSTNLDQIGTAGRARAGGTFSMASGGKGANQALAARRAGAKVLHVSTVGDDVFADPATELLRDNGVGLHGSSAF